MYLIHPAWFYLYGLIGKLFVLAIIVGIIAAIAAFVWSMVTADMYEKSQPEGWKKVKKFIVISCISGSIAVLIPSEKTMLQMAVASYATSENVEGLAKAGKIVKDELKNDFLQIIKSIKNHDTEKIK